MAFWGVWSREFPQADRTDLVTLGQGLFLSDEIYSHALGDGVAMAYANENGNKATKSALRQLEDGSWLLCAGRIDNRAELCSQFGFSTSHPPADIDLLNSAYLRWGESCPEHLIGDWAFVVWQPSMQKLFLARDQFGITSLYFYMAREYFAFATHPKLLTVPADALARINPVYLAHLLLSWKVSMGESTSRPDIRRVPPAHSLVYDGTLKLWCYWRLQDVVREQPVRTLAEAAEGALAHFDEAVRSRVRPAETIASSLSGGLDSSGVALTAGLAMNGSRSLYGYTAIPMAGQKIDGKSWFGNEWQMAASAARQAPNLIHRPLRSTTTAPLDGIREALWIHDGPTRAPENTYWMHDLMRMAKADGNQILLTGQMGNLGISWSGESIQRGRAHIGEWLRSVTPSAIKHTVKRQRLAQKLRRGLDTALHPDLAQEINILDTFSDDPYHPLCYPAETMIERRARMLGAGRSIIGCLLAEQSHAFGLEIRDPTADIRLLTYCLGVPAHLFVDPETGMERMLMRTAMAGRLPDEVRLNRRRGMQAADIISRLRADRDAMESCLDELDRGNAIHYVNLPLMRSVWQRVLEREDRETQMAAKAILLRGITVGLFVQQPGGGPRPNLERSLPPADLEMP